MAAITFNALHQKAHVREQIKAALDALREMLDVFVSNRMLQAAAEAEYARPQRQPATQSQPGNTQ